MKKGSFIVVLLAMICLPTSIFAEHTFSVDRLEFGIYGGLGFYVGPRDFEGVTHVQAYDALYFKLNNIAGMNWPGIETFGFSVGYRIDSRWQVYLQTTRQRVEFAEQLSSGLRPYYYNAMWHLEAMAEYNILNYGLEMRRHQGIYNVVPFVGLGYGITMYNAEATMRYDGHSGEFINTRYPKVGFKTEQNTTTTKKELVAVPTNLSMYIPVAVGVKWRINSNVQLKGAFHYQLHFQSPKTGKINSNLEGGTPHVQADKIYGKVVGGYHNCLFSLGAVINFGSWREDNINSNIDF